MIVVPDDEIYRVDQVFLGPDRVRFPWRWTYRQYGVALVTFIATQVVLRQIGISFGLWSALFSLLLTVWVARVVHDKVSWDRGIKVVVAEFRLELDGPRERLTPWGAVVAVRKGRAQRRAFQAFLNTAPTADGEPVPAEYVAAASGPAFPEGNTMAGRHAAEPGRQ